MKEAFATYEEENITYWTKRAPSYGDVHRDELRTSQHDVWSGVLRDAICRHFPTRVPQSIQVLEIGTGPGFFAILLAEQGYDVTAIDYTASMLAEAKANAGALGKTIHFCQMNGEELTFADQSFDVIVTRNVTWNLPHPEKAYAEWTRVLRPGGVLLNFDANWYRYLYDDTARQGYEYDRQQIAQSGVANETDGTDIPAMEAIAEKAPLSAIVRPQWDVKTLQQQGMEVAVDADIWRTVWTKEECINNSSTPMFLIEAVKGVAKRKKTDVWDTML